MAPGRKAVPLARPEPVKAEPLVRLPRHSMEFNLEFIFHVLSVSRLLGDDELRNALARENVQRARLLRERGTKMSGRYRRRADLSPLELAASFRFPHPVRGGEILDEDAITAAVAKACHLTYRKIDILKLDAALITRTLSRPYAHRHGVLALEKTSQSLLVAMTNPFDRPLLDALQGLVGLQVEPVMCSATDIHRAITEVYGFRQSVRDANRELAPTSVDFKNLEQFSRLSGLDALDTASEPVVAAVDYLLHYAFEQRASDVHLEPHRDEATVRMRIDGVLHVIHQIPKPVFLAMTSRLKVLARLDITSRKPQDGRMRAAWGDTELEMRVAVVPSAHGDKMVLRINNPSALMKDPGELGLLEEERSIVDGWLARPHGLVIVTGPTGSGKTTTLYSLMSALASPDVNILTVEDPIELVVEGFTQIQADAKTGTGFAECLRHILRQDPDVVMVGEIRDAETAVQAVQAALTGHLVFSTLHTNDSIGAVSRLRNLGIPGHLIGSTLTGVVAQRLVRRVCPSCSRDVPLTVDELASMGVKHPEDHAGELLARRGDGCVRCRNTGHLGRCGIFEVLSINRRLRQFISDDVTPEALAMAARQDGLISLRSHAIRKVALGATSVDEALAATSDDEAA